MSFSDEFKKKCADIIAEIETITQAKLKKEVKPKPLEKDKEPSVYYNIQKRSLPVGLDRPVVFRLSHDEAVMWKQLLKPKLVSYEEDGPRIVHYYDIVRDDGYKAGIYDNECDIMKDEGSDTVIEITRNYDDLEWKD